MAQINYSDFNANPFGSTLWNLVYNLSAVYNNGNVVVSGNLTLNSTGMYNGYTIKIGISTTTSGGDFATLKSGGTTPSLQYTATPDHTYICSLKQPTGGMIGPSNWRYTAPSTHEGYPVENAGEVLYVSTSKYKTAYSRNVELSIDATTITGTTFDVYILLQQGSSTIRYAVITLNKPIPIEDYEPPAIDSLDYSIDSSNIITVDITSHISGGASNSRNIVITYEGATVGSKSNAGDTESIVLSGTYSTSTNYAMVCTLSDLYSTTTYNFTIMSDQPMLSFSNTHKATGIGCVSTATNKFQVGWDTEIGTAAVPVSLKLNGDEIHTNTYSTASEKIIGRWINGKPIYRKVAYKGAIATGSSTFTFALDNPETIIAVAGCGNEGAAMSNAQCQLPYFNPTSNAYSVGLFYRNGAINFRAGSSSVIQNAYVWVEYTKTTD